MAVVPYRLDLQLFRNADFVEELTFQIDGTPIDFTGHTGSLQIRRYGNAPGVALLTANNVTSFAPGINMTLGDGMVRIWLAQAAINALPPAPQRGAPARFSYDARFSPPNGIKEVWLSGTAFVNPGVTRT